MSRKICPETGITRIGSGQRNGSKNMKGEMFFDELLPASFLFSLVLNDLLLLMRSAFVIVLKNQIYAPKVCVF